MIFLVSLLISFVRSTSYVNLTGLTGAIFGQPRRFLPYVPDSIASSPAMSVPLLLFLHGGSFNARYTEFAYGFNPVADEYGFVMVYGEGECYVIDPTQLLSQCSWNPGPLGPVVIPNDDVEYLDYLVAELLSRYPQIDPSRIFVAGHSLGAMMTFRYATDGQFRVAGIAPVAASMAAMIPFTTDWYYPPEIASFPTNLFYLHGGIDENVLMEGGHPTDGSHLDRFDLPLNYTLDYWFRQDNCEPYDKSLGVLTSDMNGKLLLTDYSESNCRNNGWKIQTLILPDAAHLWVDYAIAQDGLNWQVAESGEPKTVFAVGSDSLAELTWRMIRDFRAVTSRADSSFSIVTLWVMVVLLVLICI